MFLRLFLLLATTVTVVVSIPRSPLYYDDQLVDHNGDRWAGRTWKQRFYTYGQQFEGPGSPIFLILGGEGAIEPSTGVMYPFVTDELAVKFGAFVLEPEHRFYGTSQPISRDEIDAARADGREDPRLDLLTTDQALKDAVRLLRYVRDRLHCSRDPFSRYYCSVIAVGGSYPGFMAAMARWRHPEIIDMAYSASPPMKFYAQQMTNHYDAYYNHITQVAESAVPGCADAVRNTLYQIKDWMLNNNNNNVSLAQASQAIGVCPGTLPTYIQDTDMLWNETLMMVGYTFANHNMAYYPPKTNSSALERSCHIFLQQQRQRQQQSSSKQTSKTTISPQDILKDFLVTSLASETDQDYHWFNMSEQVPIGLHATITAGDWSGVGAGQSGDSWDFQTCTLLIETIEFGNNMSASMFPPRPWTIDWMTQHCQARFGVTPTPTKLVNEWRFDQLVDLGATRIVFTNGLADGWSVAGYQNNLTQELPVVNFPTGAHHSDLSYGGPKKSATPDLLEGRFQVQAILSQWLQELPGADKRSRRAGGGNVRAAARTTRRLRQQQQEQRL